MTVISTANTRLVWRGDAVKRRVREATMAGLDRTITACVIRARDDHEYMNRTGFMEQSVTVVAWAEPHGPNSVSARWGARANYALFLEIGTSRPWSGAPRAQERATAARGDMWAIAPPQPQGPHTDTKYITRGGVRTKIPGTGPLMEPRMSLRPAADREYPLLAERISAAYHGLPMP